MTFDAKAARRKLIERINKAKADREQLRLLSRNKNGCDHEWKTYKQIIKIDHFATVMKGQIRKYSGPTSPYFIVKGCHKCHEKHYIDLKICRMNIWGA